MWGTGSGRDFLLSLIPVSTRLPGPVQAVESPFPGEGIPTAPGAGEGAWIPRSTQVASWQEGTGSKVEGFRLVGRAGGPDPGSGRGRTRSVQAREQDGLSFLPGGYRCREGCGEQAAQCLDPRRSESG